MDQATSKDPFDALLHAGSGADTWILIGGPVGLALIIVAIYAVVVYRRNKREVAELLEEENRLSASLPSSKNKAGRDLDDEDEEWNLGEEKAPPPPAAASTPPPAAATAPSSEVDEVRRTDRSSWLARLSAGLAKTRSSWQQNLQTLFTGKVKLDEQLLEELQAALYRADVGTGAAGKLVEYVRQTIGKDSAADPAVVSAALKERAKEILSSASSVPVNKPPQGPLVILIVGVNGVGKTTTIGKLTAHYLAANNKVLLGAADTFRAAAIEQLSIWGDRLGVEVVKHKQGSDPAAVAYDAVKAALARGMDVLLIDTAGRLHAKQELMEELSKINRIIGRDLPGAPHETWLVIDATTGQNAVMQVKAFSQVVQLTGLIVTKLDGTAKGGVLLSIAEEFKLPIRYIGVGEKAADLRTFDPGDFAASLF